MTMRLWADVYDADGNRLGPGPVALKSASVTRALDGAGQVRLEVFGTDERAVTYLTNERRVKVYVSQFGTVRLAGTGILNEIGFSDAGGSVTLSPYGPDMLDELSRRTVKYNRVYSNLTVAEIVNDLLGLVTDSGGTPLWTADCSETARLSTRFDGVSVLKALQSVCEKQGLHMRQKIGESVLEIGAFGTNPENSGDELRIVRPVKIHQELYRNDDVALLESIQIGQNTRAVANRITVLGAGNNADMALTLAKCTRTTPYTIYSQTVNSRTVYYLQDDVSIAAYGVIERDIQIRDIAPLTTVEADEINAANALYDAASAWLERNSQALTTYRVKVRKCTKTVRPGDKVRLVYTGKVQHLDSGEFVYRQINGLFWVIKATESLGENTTLDLELCSVDRYAESAARIIVGALEQIHLQGVAVQPTQSHYLYGPEQAQIDTDNNATFQLPLTNRTYKIDVVLMRVRTQPFTSTTQGAASGGGGAPTSSSTSHQHLIMRGNDGTGLKDTLATRRFTIVEQTTGELYHFDAQSDIGSGARFFDMQPSGAHTHTVTIPAHVHTLEYGIYRDTQRPAGMTITVNGTEIATGKGATGSNFDETFDITDAIKARSGGVQNIHDIVISCTSGQGEVLVTFDVVELILPFSWSGA